ncbi:MAG: Lrp/AsnC family transcriptional regulator [Candidatus Bathyarchaeota archaeon]|nr:Lrp/AsnC family transcriptional regulator [Candidatus Bathyarchaeota archaeon]MDH5788807.1 Lrp/AsnC family transcriptional regulator [Candidatus Bathyarchaeota archaeon]
MKKEIREKLLAELLKNSKRSDRELARDLKVSQPTITRVRQRLEREGFIRSYTIIPDWRKIGFEIMAFTFTKMRPEILSDELIGKVKAYASKFPNAIFATTGEGIGMTGVIVSLHKDYRDYAQKLALFRMDWGKHMEDIKSFVMVLGEGEIKELSFSYLAKTIRP